MYKGFPSPSLVPRSHALRGNARRDALRPVIARDATRSVAHRHSHAERGNEKIGDCPARIVVMFPTPLDTTLFAFAPSEWLDHLIRSCNALAPEYTFFAFDFNIRSLLAVILVSLCCG